jgi:mono/diheme cytochrome c family protein
MNLLVFAAIASLGGNGCGVSAGVVYSPAVTYKAAAVNYGYAQTYSAPVYTPQYQVAYRASYVGYPVANEENARQLLIIEQQSKALTKIIDQQNDRIGRLESERLSLPHSRQGGFDDLAPQAAQGHPGVRVLQQRCAQCHSGAQGAKNGWTMPADLANPSIKMRLRISDAVTRAENPMPKGMKLSESEMQALREYCSFGRDELNEEEPPPAADPPQRSRQPPPPPTRNQG